MDNMNSKVCYKCSECSAEFEFSPHLMLCPHCSQEQQANEPLRGILELKYSFKYPPHSPDLLWPIHKSYFPLLPIGNTPLWQAKRINQSLNFPNLYIKDDTHNLTGSYKDRASILVAAAAKKFGIKEIALASTGNAASSMAGIGAAAGLRIRIFLPETAPKAKMLQSLQYGAKVITVAGNYDKAFELSLEYSKKYQLLSRNTAYNPLTIEGKKSAAFEIWQQLKDVPDYLFVPTGDGVIISGLYKGFKELLGYNFIQRMPCLVAVQAQGSAAIHNALQKGSFTPVNARTIADSISVDVPRCGYYALNYLQQFAGKSVLVSDEAILHAQKELSAQAGLFAEPAAAAAYAGFLKMKQQIPVNAKVVLMITGNGLKDIDSAMKSVDFPHRAIHTLEEVQ